jgi:hypothetical protein
MVIVPSTHAGVASPETEPGNGVARRRQHPKRERPEAESQDGGEHRYDYRDPVDRHADQYPDAPSVKEGCIRPRLDKFRMISQVTEDREPCSHQDGREQYV